MSHSAAPSALFAEESLQLLLHIEQDWQQAAPQDIAWRAQMLRQLHQLKGVAASFNQLAAADCCHQLETLLNQHDNAALLPAMAVSVSQKLARLHELLHNAKQPPVLPADHGDMMQSAPEQRWLIDFKPLPTFFKNGQDPLQYLKKLQQLGEMTVSADHSNLPDFADYDARLSYLSWQITLDSSADEAALRAIFDWVKDDCQLAIQPLPAADSPATKLPAAVSDSSSQIKQILQRQQQENQWLDSLEQYAAVLPANSQTLLRQLQLSRQQSWLALQKLLLKSLSAAYSRLPSLLTTLTTQTGKQARVQLADSELSVPPLVADLLSDVLIQLLRNAIAHGIESPADRIAAGKPAVGTISISQQLDGMQLQLTMRDDGVGLQADKILAAAGQADADIHQLIFQAGLTTANAPSLLSGRGVGLDLVRQHIQRLQGSIRVESVNGAGCLFQLRLPLTQTLQVLQAVTVDDQQYLLAPEQIIDDLLLSAQQTRHINGRGQFVEYQQQWLPVCDLRRQFKLAADFGSTARLLIIKSADKWWALPVDGVRLPAEYLLSSLTPHYRPVTGILAMAVTPQQPALWLDIAGLMAEPA